MKRKTKTLKKTSIDQKREESKMKGTLASHLHVQLGISALQHQSSSSTNTSNRFLNHLESVDEDATLSTDSDAYVDDKDPILTQDFFW